MASNPAASILLPRTTGPFSLLIPPTTYCPGSDVEGEVLLEFPNVQDELIDEVIVDLRGTLSVSALRTAERIPSTGKQELVSLRTSLWKRGTAYPPPDSHVLRLPFRFHLPSDPRTVLPSVSWHAWRDSVEIAYYVEVIALRPATFFGSGKRMRGRLNVVSRGDPTLCTSIRSLRGFLAEGVEPTWKAVHTEKKMRRGIWGEYSTARVELLIPNRHGILPHAIDIPILIAIKTTTARLSRTKADKHPADKPVFPALDVDSNHCIFVHLQQTFAIRAGGHTKHCTNETVLAYIKPRDIHIQGPSESGDAAYYKDWQADTNASDREEMGRWVQGWTVQRTVKLPRQRFPPTFECVFADCAYVMSVQVPFPGMGNDVKVSTPITLDSGINYATPQKPEGSGRPGPARRSELRLEATLTESESEPSGGRTDIHVLPRVEELQSARLLVPPTYFDAVYRDGDVVGQADGA